MTGMNALPPKTHPSLRLNSICPYYTMFPLEFPFEALSRADKHDWILDPFCGRGTTNFAARLRGLRSVGIDSNPVAAAVAEAKLVAVPAADLASLCKKILKKVKAVEVPQGAFWKLAFHPQTLEDICKLRSYLLDCCDSPAEVALRAVILGILHGPKTKGLPTYLSNQMPRTYATKPDAAVRYWDLHKEEPYLVDVLDAVTRRAYFSFADLPPIVEGKILQADSRNVGVELKRRRFNWVVTSPPYYGMRSYISDQWLRNWFMGGQSSVEYSQKGQLSHRGKDQFIANLASVWKKTATLSVKNGNLIIRFGAIPSAKTNPSDIVRKSIALADAGWRIHTIKNAGLASEGRRQAEQFIRSKSKPIHEIDVYATLEF